MTCKECVHYEVCGKGVEGAMDRDQLHFESSFPRREEFDCPDFKPKSRFVELPCEVGQTVYFLDVCRTAEDFGKRFVSFGVVAKVSCDHKFVVVKGGSVLDWGDVFLSREEAEKALRERNEK